MVKTLLALFFVLPFFFISFIFGYYQNIDVGILSKQFPVKTEEKVRFQSSRPKAWSSLKAISPYLRGAILVSEDWAFYQHEGIDTNQLFSVLQEGLEKGSLSRGASTITQQLAKNLFLTPEKSIVRKIKEMVYAIKLEKNFKKNQIFEFYLNIIEFGKDLYGIENASWYYFNTSPANLSIRQSAFLAMLLPNPKKYSISFREGELTAFAREQIVEIIEKMQKARFISAEQRHQALQERFTWERP